MDGAQWECPQATDRGVQGGRDMAEAKTAVAHKPVWIDLASGDAAGSRDFYSKLFGWKVEVYSDPKFRGYAMARIGGNDVAGIGPQQMDEAPTAWTVYIASADAADTAKKAEVAGGKVIMEPMTIGDSGVMAILQDPSGAYLGVWQANKMAGTLVIGKAGAYGWAELNARGVDKAKTFYQKVFGWGEKKSDMADGLEYTEFLVSGESIAGGMEMNYMVPAQVPSYWQGYFTVEGVDKWHREAVEHGRRGVLCPQSSARARVS